MAGDIKLNANGVTVEGGELHSIGGGYSFADRKKGNSERWVWYAQDGAAHLWSQKIASNVLSVTPSDGADGLPSVSTSKFTSLGITTGSIQGMDLFGVGPFNLFLTGRVKVEGTLHATGAITQASSIALKENVAELSGQEAMATLQGLNAVKYNYKADSQKEQRIGFIAEEVPDLVASSKRDRLSPMDLIAVLTKAVQEQQKTITELASEMNTLKQQNGGM